MGSEYKMGVSALIVAYNPDEKLKILANELVKAKIISNILIWDNASNDKELLKIIDEESSITNIYYSEENVGLAKALNNLVDKATDEFVITFDQDSYMEAGDIDRLYVSLISMHSKNSKYVSIGPKIVLDDNYVIQNKIVKKPYLITSGNLSYKFIYEKYRYDEDFFIDCLDYDFSLKVRRNYYLCQDKSIVLKQNLGECVDGVRKHSDIRMYYMLRNFIRLLKRHFLRYPIFLSVMTVLFIKNYTEWMKSSSDKDKVKKIVNKAMRDA